jgi:cell division protease FtsH|tara:strand:- start:2671 stop:4644 length:1974 start_codon:yes stop_codon:yes gene_type:complete
MDDIRKLLAGIASVAVIVFIFFQSYFGSDVAISSGKFALATNGAENGNERLETLTVTSKMTYGHFLEYLDMGWVSKVDLYDNGRSAIILASSPELGNRSQQIRVEIPAGASQLITKLREAHVDFDAHANRADNLTMSLKVFGNFVLPVLFLLFVFYLFSQRANRGNPGGGGPGQILNIGKSKNDFQLEKQTGITFDQVAGIEEAKEEFEEVVTFLKKPEKFTAVGAKIPRGVLLVGPPGTGKTLLAKAIAGEAGVPFVSISGSEFVEMFVGVGASRVRDLFKKAKTNAPCIIFIDEIDAVGRQRGAGVGGGNDEREQTLNQLLTEMDGFEGNSGIIVVAATNRVDILDSALLRPGRFDRQITVNLPDLKGRTAILNVHARNKAFNEDIRIEKIAQRTPGFSGADLANLLNEASILAARDKREVICADDINRATDRIITGLEGNCLTDSRSKRLVAYHEIGHAITGTMLEYHDPVEKVTLIPRGQARGLTWFTPMEDQGLISRGQLLARITGTLGGRAAEEIIFGNTEVTTGASNDIMQATSLARQMVTRYGMSNVGPMAFETQSNNQVFLDGTMAGGSSITNDTATRIDKEVKLIISYCHKQAAQILTENREALDQLSTLLIKQETIEGNEFREILSDYSPLPEKTGYVSYFEKNKV